MSAGVFTTFSAICFVFCVVTTLAKPQSQASSSLSTSLVAPKPQNQTSSSNNTSSQPQLASSTKPPVVPSSPPQGIPFLPFFPTLPPLQFQTLASGQTVVTLPPPRFPVAGDTNLAVLGLSTLGTAGLAAAGVFLALTLTGKKKRSLREDAFMESLKYFDLAMELDSELCLPFVLCEAASKHNKEATQLEKAAADTAKAG